ncbi:hypothetical protein [Paenibacillus naphthalenovorans]
MTCVHPLYEVVSGQALSSVTGCRRSPVFCLDGAACACRQNKTFKGE